MVGCERQKEWPLKASIHLRSYQTLLSRKLIEKVLSNFDKSSNFHFAREGVNLITSVQTSSPFMKYKTDTTKFCQLRIGSSEIDKITLFVIEGSDMIQVIFVNIKAKCLTFATYNPRQ